MDRELYEKLAIGTRYYQLGEEMMERIEEEEGNLRAIKREYENVENKKVGTFETYLPICKAVFIIGGIILALTILVVLFDSDRLNDFDTILFIVYLSIAVVAAFFCKRIFGQKLALGKKECAQLYETVYKQKIQEQEAKVAEVTEATKNFAQENYHLVEFMPPEYRDLQPMSYMLLAVVNGRADTLKEAINLYETQLHRWHLESLAERSVEAQEYLNRAMDELNARQAETNAHLAAIEYMKYVEYFKNSSKQ